MVKSDVERIAILETRAEELTDEVRELKAEVRDLRDGLMRARGARWILAALISAGGFLFGLLDYLVRIKCGE